MNSLKTFYFPATDIYSVRQFPLFLLFQNVHLIQPVEKSPDLNKNETENNFISSDFCHLHIPCPLGEHRDRFLHLVEDIRNRKDDYASQLSSLTLASMSRSAQAAKESERDIVHAIFTPGEILEAQDSVDDKTEKLWTSRLVLAIAEILDLEEEEIARGLALLEDDETELFQSLHGDDASEEDSPFGELIKLKKNIGSANSSNERNRTKAWKTLFQETKNNDVELLLTNSQLSANLLLEKYEAESEIPPLQLTGIELPSLIGLDDETGFTAVSSFVENNDDLLIQISDVFQTIAEADSANQAIINNSSFEVLVSEWNKALDVSFPALQYGRSAIAIHVLPGFSCSGLLTDTPPEQSKFLNGILIAVE